MAEIEAALSKTTTTAPEGVRLSGPTPSGMVRLRFTGTGPTLLDGVGRVEPGEFDCQEALAVKLLGSRTGDYVLASGAASDSEVVEALAAADGEPDPAEKRKEKK